VSVTSTAERAQLSGIRGTRAWSRTHWLVLGCYLLMSVGLTWRLWVDPASRAQVYGSGISNDVLDNNWFMRYAATAVAHGHLPALITHALNAPQGINLMWNTGMLLPGVLLTPVTLLAGPQVSLTILLTLGFAGSAGSMFVVLRRWGAGLTAAAIGGAVYGFSPALRIAAGTHIFLEFAVLLPLIADAALRIVTGRGHTIRTGIWLGLLISAQLFISEELLADLALATVILVVVLAASRPSAVLARARDAAAGLATGAAVTVVTCGYALWIQFHGPLAQHGTPWNPASFSTLPADFVTAPEVLLWHSQNFLHFEGVTRQSPAETLAYIGWPLLVVVAAAAVLYWRDLRIRAAAVTFVVLEAFTVGPNPVQVAGFRIPANVLPWHWVSHLPLVGQIMPTRLPLVADGVAAAVLAFALSRALEKTSESRRWQSWAVGVVIAGALVPLIPLPLQAMQHVPPPAGWQTTFGRLHLGPDAQVLVIPLDSTEVMDWQAVTGQPGSLIGGYCLAPNQLGQAGYCGHPFGKSVQHVFYRLNVVYLAEAPDYGYTTYTLNMHPGRYARARLPSLLQLRTALRALRPAAFVAATTSDSRLGRFLIQYFGPPTVKTPTVLGWRVHPCQYRNGLAGRC
jgi:hypothetical protein